MQKLISIDIKADFGMLKKPDTNEPVYLTYNMLHKPAVLGIIGAIIGEAGFKEKGKFPDYYIKLKDIRIGIQPLNHEKGNYQKTIIAYNNTTGLASKEEGGNMIVTEQTLIAPSYRCYLLLDNENSTHQKIGYNLKNFNAEYLPYLGKNEFSVWWEKYTEYEFEEFVSKDNFKINSVFIKERPVIEGKTEGLLDWFDSSDKSNTFIYFERLPIGYDENLFQYNYMNFAYTDWSFKPNYQSNISHLLKLINNEQIIQVF
jgi:CRISPR-associated protein Cas5h